VRTVFITGASSGFGAAIARRFAARGDRVIAAARRAERLAALADELGPDLLLPLTLDVRDRAGVERTAAALPPAFAEVDILVNNAGFATGGPFYESDPERELEQVRVLVEAPVSLISAYAPHMVKRRSGAILNVASTAAFQPLPYSAGYSAAKAYVLAFSEAIHWELRGHGVTVTALCPGPVKTDFWEIANWQVSSGQSFERALPSPAMITPEQAAKAGVDGLASGSRVVVPGLPMRAAMEASRLIPHAIKLPAIAWAMRRR